MELQAAAPPLRTSKSVLGVGDEVAPILDELGVDLIEDIHMEAGMHCRFSSRSDVQVIASGEHQGERWTLEIYLQDRSTDREVFLFPLDSADPALIGLGLAGETSLQASRFARDRVAARLLGSN